MQPAYLPPIGADSATPGRGPFRTDEGRATSAAWPARMFATGTTSQPSARRPIFTTTQRRPRAGLVGRSSTTWPIGILVDDWPACVPVTPAEVDVFEAWFGDLFDELFGRS